MSGEPLILGIAGSPRRKGNSDQLLDAALGGARTAGARTRLMVAAETGMNPCRGCNACSKTGRCIQRDGGEEVYRAIDDADAIIVASPVFFATVPGVLKILYDRMQPYWARVHVLGEEPPARRPGGIVLVRAGGDPYGFDSAEAPTRSVFAVLGIDVVGVVKITGVDTAGDVAAVHPEGLEEARLLGNAVAEAAWERQSEA